MTLTCYIIDDEPLALRLLESYVSKTPFLQLTGKFTSAISAIDSLRKTPPDIIYLDIQMAELNGMEFAKMVAEKTRIIFTTAFQQYALESYKVNALDYLLKPFSYADFLTASNKALQWCQLSTDGQLSEKHLENSPQSIFIKTDYRLVQIELNRISFIESLKDYLKIYFEDGEPIVTRITMKAMEDMLPQQKFMRVHRSFIVSIDKIKVVENNRVVFGKTRIPISDLYKEAFYKTIEKRTLK